MSSIPRRRFGRTELSMPIITCGGMRLQQTWAPPPGFTMADVEPECQAGLEAIIRKCIGLGINHFETARGYGSSELQYGVALKKLMDEGLFKREDIILQTKNGPKPTKEAFEAEMEKSFATLGLESNGLGYVDLFAFHGINKPCKLDWVLGHCLPIIRRYQAEGKIRFVGFSTHGMEPLITKAINSNEFDYVNLHYHFIGSYTASGSGANGTNRVAVEAARRMDMGVFIISPTDKGGALYKSPKRFAEACAPLSPIEFNNLFLLSQRQASAERQHLVHTLVVGAARASDFDEHMKVVARLDQADALVPPIEAKLRAMYAEACGTAWAEGWWRGLPDPFGNVDGAGALVDPSRNPHAVHFPMIAWLWSICAAWGFEEYARERYSGLVRHGKKLEAERTAGKSIEEFLNSSMNDYGPGCDDALALAAGELDAPLAGAACKEQVLAALEWARTRLHPERSSGDGSEAAEEETLPDMRPWTCWPDRPKPPVKFDWNPYIAGKLHLLGEAIAASDSAAICGLCAKDARLSFGKVASATGAEAVADAWLGWTAAKHIDLQLTPETSSIAGGGLLVAKGGFSHAHEDLRSQTKRGALAATFRMDLGDWRLIVLSLTPQ